MKARSSYSRRVEKACEIACELERPSPTALSPQGVCTSSQKPARVPNNSQEIRDFDRLNIPFWSSQKFPLRWMKAWHLDTMAFSHFAGPHCQKQRESAAKRGKAVWVGSRFHPSPELQRSSQPLLGYIITPSAPHSEKQHVFFLSQCSPDPCILVSQTHAFMRPSPIFYKIVGCRFGGFCCWFLPAAWFVSLVTSLR